MKGSGGGARQKPGKLARPNDANHMGPEGVESSIFHAKDEPLFPKRDPASTGAPPNAEAAGDDINAELAPLNELSGVNGAAANGFPPPPPKQAVMRRSFPPVGVSLVMQDTMNEVLASPERMANVQDEVVRTIANVFMTQKERFRVMHFKPSDPPAAVTIQMNIVADRTENDMRSPMQLAAELVTQSQDARSPLRAAPVFQALRSGSIAEDPFPGTKQDSWAGGVATLRPGGVEGAPEAKKKQTAASFKTKAPPAAAAPPANAAAPPGNFAQTNGGQQDAAAGPKPATPAVPVAPMDMAASPAPAAPAQQLTAKELAATNTSELPGGTMLKDGGEYTGDLQQGLRHGRGTHVYPNGDVFNGIFQKDKRFGIGRLVLANDGGFYLGVSLESAFVAVGVLAMVGWALGDKHLEGKRQEGKRTLGRRARLTKMPLQEPPRARTAPSVTSPDEALAGRTPCNGLPLSWRRLGSGLVRGQGEAVGWKPRARPGRVWQEAARRRTGV